MANLITIENFPASNIAEISALSADAAAGQAVINVENAQGIVADSYVLVGVVGGEGGQILKVQSVSTNQITFTTNLTIKHYKGETVTRIRSNQGKIYRATNVDGTAPSDGSFGVIATVTLEADQLYTQYNDTTGGSGYWYKQTYYNDVSLVETALADALAARGGNYGNYTDVDSVRIEAGIQNNRWIADQFVYSKLLAAQSEVNASLAIAGYTLPMIPTPELVKQITELLAAGYVLIRDYGAEHEATNKDGFSKIKMAREMLAKIESRETVLTDTTTGVALASSDEVRGYPDNTAADQTPSEDRLFRISDRY